MKPGIFISYSHSDKQFVQKFIKHLKKKRVKYFVDWEHISWGVKITEKVREALKDCIAIVVVISPGSLKSQWVPFEIGHAMGANSMGANKIILPLLTHESLDIPDYLKEFKWHSNIESAITFFDTDFWKDHCENSRTVMSRDLRKLREHIKKLNDEASFLESYMPGHQEPEDL